MIGLYFYRARNAAAGSSMDLADASCRPDPDFEALTLGLCRPGLRTALRRQHQREPVELLFYTHDGRDRILLVAAMRTSAIFRGHAAAQASLSAKGPLPLNIVTAGAPCLRGTVIDPTTLHVIAIARPRPAGARPADAKPTPVAREPTTSSLTLGRRGFASGTRWR